MKPPVRQKSQELWSCVCETYANNPDMTVFRIAELCGTSRHHAARIIRAYIGKGDKIITVPSRVFT